jgi:Holliday junction resolvase-like predicted endonuclease
LKDDKILAFIEVRLRSNHQFGSSAVRQFGSSAVRQFGSSAVRQFGSSASNNTPQKQQKLILAAQHFLQQHAEKMGQLACRFDAVLMNKINFQTIEWLSNAFET